MLKLSMPQHPHFRWPTTTSLAQELNCCPRLSSSTRRRLSCVRRMSETTPVRVLVGPCKKFVNRNHAFVRRTAESRSLTDHLSPVDLQASKFRAPNSAPGPLNHQEKRNPEALQFQGEQHDYALLRFDHHHLHRAPLAH